VSGHDTMRGRNTAFEKRREIGVRRAVRKHPPNEAIAKRRLPAAADRSSVHSEPRKESTSW
jgi:hypothetical protein